MNSTASEVVAAEAVTEESIDAEEYIDEPFSAMEHDFDPYATVEYAAVAIESGLPEFETSAVAPPSPFDAIADAEPDEAAFAPSKIEAGCPFCGYENAGQTFECEGCHAVLSLSDLEAVLANYRRRSKRRQPCRRPNGGRVE